MKGAIIYKAKSSPKIKNKKRRNNMNKYEKPEILVITLEQTDVIRTSNDGVIVEPGEGWE